MIGNFIRQKIVKQSTLLMGMQILGMLLSFAFTVMVTKGLDVASYGVFRYAMTYLALSMTLLQFGWPFAAARLLASQAEKSAQEQIIGTCVLLLIGSTIAGAIMTVIVFYVAQNLGWNLPRALLLIAPFSYVTLGQGMIASICQGLNRISILSFQQVLPYLLLLPLTGLQLYVLRTYSLTAAIVGYVLVFSLVIAFGFLRLGVAFQNWRSWLFAIFKENKRTGFPIYIGGIFGVASTQFIALWTAGFVDPIRYGQYGLALAIATPVATLISCIGTVMFRSSASMKCLPRKVLLGSLAFGVLLWLGYCALTEALVIAAFGAKYAASIRMAQALGIGSLFVGWGDILQRFLGAHGRGKPLCVSAILTGAVAIISAACLLGRWGIHAAILSSILAGVTYFGLMLLFYMRHTLGPDFINSWFHFKSLGRLAARP